MGGKPSKESLASPKSAHTSVEPVKARTLTALSTLALNRNEYFFPLPKLVLEALERSQEKLTTYAQPKDHEALRARICADLGLPPHLLFLTHGAEDALVKIMCWYRQHLGSIVVADFCWATYLELAQGFDYVIHKIPCNETENSFQTDLAHLHGWLEKHPPSLVLLASPNNPTGHTLPVEELVSLAKSFPAHVFVIDGVYDNWPSTNSRLPAQHDNVFFIGSFSKYFGLPGLRVGFLVGHAPQAFHLNLGLQPFSIDICMAALNSYSIYEGNRDTMLRFAFELKQHSTECLKVYSTYAPFALVKLSGAIWSEKAFVEAEKASGVKPKYFVHDGFQYLRWGLGPKEINAQIEKYMKKLARK